MKIKKEYVNAIKDTLSCYPLLTGRQELLEGQLNSLKTYDGLKSVGYGSERIKTSNINNSTEQTALHNLDREKEIMDELSVCNYKIDVINAAIKKLPKDYFDILNLRFIKGYSWFEAVDELFISERTGRNRAHKGLESLAIIFYGERCILKDDSKVV